MKTILSVGLVVGAISPGGGIARSAGPSAQQPSARKGINEQLNAITARIDRRVARGRLSRNDAMRARREIDDIQAQASEDRLQGAAQAARRSGLTWRDASISWTTRSKVSEPGFPAARLGLDIVNVGTLGRLRPRSW